MVDELDCEALSLRYSEVLREINPPSRSVILGTYFCDCDVDRSLVSRVLGILECLNRINLALKVSRRIDLYKEISEQLTETEATKAATASSLSINFFMIISIS